MARAPTVTVRSRFDQTGLKRGGAEAKSYLGRWGKTAGTAVNKSLGGGLRGLGGTLQTVVGGAFTGVGAAAVATGAAAMAGAALNEFRGFETGVRKVMTVVPAEANKAFGDVAAQSKQLAQSLAEDHAQVNQAVYDLYSRGFGDTIETVISAADDLAEAGLVPLTEANDILTQSLNAFRLEGDQAQATADVLFRTVQLGSAELDALGAGLGVVGAAAAAFDVELSDAAAALGYLSTQGFNMGTAASGLNQLIAELAKGTTAMGQAFQDVTGMTFPEFIAAGNGLGEVMVALEQAQDDTGKSLVELAGSQEAARVATGLLGGEFAAMADEVAAAEGTVEGAAETMRDSTDEALQAMKVAWEGALIEIGDDVAAFVAGVTPMLTDIIGLMGTVGAAVTQVRAYAFGTEQEQTAAEYANFKQGYESGRWTLANLENFAAAGLSGNAQAGLEMLLAELHGQMVRPYSTATGTPDPWAGVASGWLPHTPAAADAFGDVTTGNLWDPSLIAPTLEGAMTGAVVDWLENRETGRGLGQPGGMGEALVSLFSPRPLGWTPTGSPAQAPGDPGVLTEEEAAYGPVVWRPPGGWGNWRPWETGDTPADDGADMVPIDDGLPPPLAPFRVPDVTAHQTADAVAAAVSSAGDRSIELYDRDGVLVGKTDRITLDQFRDAPLLRRHIRRCTGAPPTR